MASGSWIIDRVTDNPAEPHFVAMSAVSWFRALSIAINDVGFSQTDLDGFYSGAMQASNRDNQTSAFINLVSAVNYYTTLKAIQTTGLEFDTANASVVIWYYCIYHAAQAMCDSANQPNLHNHAKTANVWTNHIVEKNKARYPFSIYIRDLTKANLDSTVTALKNGSTQTLMSIPVTPNDAEGAIATYLKGTVDRIADTKKEELKISKEFTNNNWTSFSFKGAQARRDSSLQGMRCSFLNVAIRMRGKANYRDHIFLTHNNKKVPIAGLIDDQLNCCCAFLNMAAVYVKKRSRKKDWADFTTDFHKNTNLTLGLSDLFL